MQGSLSTLNVAELLLEVHLSGLTGILRLNQGDVKKGVYFKAGAIVFAHSNLKSERLGETLLRLGKITDDEFRVASVDVVERGKRLGKTLCEKGFLSEGEVHAGVSYQMQQIIYSIFNWDHGEYEFVERERPVFEDIMVDVSTANVLIGGIRHITNITVLKRVTGIDEERIVDRNTGILRLPRTDLEYGEETILACIAENSSVSKLRSLSRLGTLEFGRALYSLLLCGLVHFREATGQDQPRSDVHEKPSAFATRPIPPHSQSPVPEKERLKTFSEAEMRTMILETAKRFRDAADEEVLNVLPDCTLAEIEQAQSKMTSIFQPLLQSEERYRNLKDQLEFVSRRIADASENLKQKSMARLPLSETALPSVPAEVHVQTQEMTRKPDPAPAPIVEPTMAEVEERLAKEPDNVSLLRVFGKRLQQVGKSVDGEKQLLRALEIEPQSVENHLVLADFYQTEGLKLKAFKHLNIVLHLEPDNAQALQMLSLKKERKALFEISIDRKEPM